MGRQNYESLKLTLRDPSIRSVVTNDQSPERSDVLFVNSVDDVDLDVNSNVRSSDNIDNNYVDFSNTPKWSVLRYVAFDVPSLEFQKSKEVFENRYRYL